MVRVDGLAAGQGAQPDLRAARVRHGHAQPAPGTQQRPAPPQKGVRVGDVLEHLARDHQLVGALLRTGNRAAHVRLDEPLAGEGVAQDRQPRCVDVEAGHVRHPQQAGVHQQPGLEQLSRVRAVRAPQVRHAPRTRCA